MYKVLVCDDDKDIVEAISIYLETAGYEVVKAYDGFEALNIMKNNSASGTEQIHLVIIDIMMPNMDGIMATRKIREFSQAPIIFLTAKSEDADKILGLDIGADDYVTKPFNPLELVARVKSQIRRYTKLGAITEKGVDDDKLIVNGGLVINDSAKSVTVDGDEVKLTPIEYSILLFLTENRGRVYNTSQIYEAVWDEDAIASDNIIAVHIRHIREKIEINPKEPRYLKVVWGQGYKVEKL
ncbi:DNA-binding response regulator, OmpR family, contains REC and winged-helix (wHTH) domain [Lachnospiraceae bacterium NE2001]|nr:DNA-binding response regulator, OmpR family, contains REC and winged-helix (wHTH) domain [Lachnospiraceae bacterium NE2001]